MSATSPANSIHLPHPNADGAHSHRLDNPRLTGMRERERVRETHNPSGGPVSSPQREITTNVEVQKLPLASEGRQMLDGSRW